MAIPEVVKTNFQALEKAFENGDIALLECMNRNSGEPAYAICAINILRQVDREPEIELVPFGLMFSHNPYEMLIPPTDPDFDRSEQSPVSQKYPKTSPTRSKAIGEKVSRRK